MVDIVVREGRLGRWLFVLETWYDVGGVSCNELSISRTLRDVVSQNLEGICR